MQGIYVGSDGVARFRENQIITYLLQIAEAHGSGLNHLAKQEFSNEDREQLAQLIGFSVSGYGDLPYASRESISEADNIVAELTAKPADKVAELETQILCLMRRISHLESLLAGAMSQETGGRSYPYKRDDRWPTSGRWRDDTKYWL